MKKHFLSFVAGAGAMGAAFAASAADSAIVTAANGALQTAQSGGESVGGTVVAVVCALAIVGVIIALVRKV